MTLRRVFSQDSDFKESMFARQIAVMKGQAWNVVETLKQPDHGPLELTRRMRVCVWDDIVDVPVAIPMRTPSVETARLKRAKQQNTLFDQQEEMDIGVGAGNGQLSAPADLLLGSPTSELPNPNRFELTRDDGHLGDLGRVDEADADVDVASNGRSNISPVTTSALDFGADSHRKANMNLSNSLTLPTRPKHKSRFSFEFPHHNSGSTRKQRSLSTRSGKKPDLLYEGDDLEGDLGYSAASDMERHQKKVIVERLEAVKSSNPVFTWC